MSITLRIPRDIHGALLDDLRSPHPFAAERVAFCHVTFGNRGHEHSLVLVTDFWSVPDDQFIDDPESGARINGTAIRFAMQSILDHGRGVLHVHFHDWPGSPIYSKMDRTEIPRLVHSFRPVNPDVPHGMLVLSPDSARASIALPRCEVLETARQISIVGWPTRIIKVER